MANHLQYGDETYVTKPVVVQYNRGAVGIGGKTRSQRLRVLGSQAAVCQVEHFAFESLEQRMRRGQRVRGEAGKGVVYLNDADIWFNAEVGAGFDVEAAPTGIWLRRRGRGCKLHGCGCGLDKGVLAWTQKTGMKEGEN